MPPANLPGRCYRVHATQSAQLLGVSLGTIRRKIARGELRAERVHRPQGHVWQVWPVSMLATDRGEQLALALAPLVEASVNAAVAPLRAELADVRTLLSARDQELGAALERIRALEAPKELTPQERPQISPTDASSVELTQTPSTPRNGRHWWAFWRG